MEIDAVSLEHWTVDKSKKPAIQNELHMHLFDKIGLANL
jgi:hypothetical protein